MFEKIRRWYLLGLWSEAMVCQAVTKQVITREECDTIIKEGTE